MKRYLTTSLLIAVALSGCVSNVSCSAPDTTLLPHVTYCMGKVAGDGQEAVFRDVWLDGKPALSHFGAGQSLSGQVLQGVAGDAALAGGMVGAAALLRPARFNSNETNNLSNGQQQGQVQGQGQYSNSAATSTSGASSSSTAVNRNANWNNNSNAAVNSNTTTVTSPPSGSGGDSCQGNCSDNSHNH